LEILHITSKALKPNVGYCASGKNWFSDHFFMDDWLVIRWAGFLKRQLHGITYAAGLFGVHQQCSPCE
jgi:hypothetical protein